MAPWPALARWRRWTTLERLGEGAPARARTLGFCCWRWMPLVARPAGHQTKNELAGSALLTAAVLPPAVYE